MPGSPQADSGSTRVLALDAVRGVAILGVIATHSLTAAVAATGSYAFPPAVFRFFDFGQFGVHLFFFLSGWLMFSLYTGGRPFSQRVYWSRRFARIWPLWLIFLVLSYSVWGVPDTGWPTWVNFVLAAVFLGWLSAPLIVLPLGGLTIQQEMGHYLLFSLFRRRGVAFLAGTVLIGYGTVVVARLLQSATSPDSVVYAGAEAWIRLQLFHSWPFFLLGGAGCVVLRRWRAGGVGAVIPGGPWPSLMVAAALFAGMFTTYAQGTPGYFVVGYVLMAAGIAVAANQVPVLGPALRSIGRYSYFIYFFHFWVLKWLEARYRSSDLPGDGSTSELQNIVVLMSIWTITLAVSWAVGWVSWRILEKPILDLAHRRVPSPPRTPVPQG